MTGFGEAFARFDAELDAAVSRARRVRAEARADGAAFRAETAKIAEAVRKKDLVARPDELTSEQLRDKAAKFREEQGLPVEQLPSAEELVQAGLVRAEPPVQPADDEDDDFSQEKILSASNQRVEEQPPPAPPAPTPPPAPVRGRRRPVPRTSDEDEDFSQERILFEG